MKTFFLEINFETYKPDTISKLKIKLYCYMIENTDNVEDELK